MPPRAHPIDSASRIGQRLRDRPYRVYAAHWGIDLDLTRTGRIFGWLFIGTFITSIPARLLFIHGLGASWSDVRFVAGEPSTASLKLGAVLEFGLMVTQIGTAVVIYPLVRRQSETVSLGTSPLALWSPSSPRSAS